MEEIDVLKINGDDDDVDDVDIVVNKKLQKIIKPKKNLTYTENTIITLKFKQIHSVIDLPI